MVASSWWSGWSSLPLPFHGCWSATLSDVQAPHGGAPQQGHRGRGQPQAGGANTLPQLWKKEAPHIWAAFQVACQPVG